MTIKLRDRGRKPIRNTNKTDRFMETYKASKKGSVFEVIDIEGNRFYFMKFTQNHMMRLGTSLPSIFTYNADNCNLQGKHNTTVGGSTYHLYIKVAEWFVREAVIELV